MREPEIIYEDNQVVVAVKPQNMPSQGDASGDESFFDIIREYIRVKYNKPGQAFLGLVHRLDRPAGGLMVFARTSKAASRLSAQMRDGAFCKTYYAVVTGSLPESGSLEDYMVKDCRTNISRIAKPDEEGAKLAKLAYEVEQSADGFSLLRIALDTGRSHQIRVQMCAAGAPLAGDRKYGGADAPQLCLWATELRFEHPTRHVPMDFQCAWPSYYPWSLFAFVGDAHR